MCSSQTYTRVRANWLKLTLFLNRYYYYIKMIFLIFFLSKIYGFSVLPVMHFIQSLL